MRETYEFKRRCNCIERLRQTGLSGGRCCTGLVTLRYTKDEHNDLSAASRPPCHLPSDMDSGTVSRRPQGPEANDQVHPLKLMNLRAAGSARVPPMSFTGEWLGAPSFFKCHRVEILTVTPDLSFPNIPYMGVWKISAFVRCAVNAGKTAKRDDG